MSEVLKHLLEHAARAHIDETEAYSDWLEAAGDTRARRALLWDVYVTRRAATARACEVLRLEQDIRAELGACA